ncbi:helix-turn-helix domain-containing protein, partial [Porticoccaceae bacterium]|nr:helix-turn-helix domain-containing protein [Porticoccaceae bacterium]
GVEVSPWETLADPDVYDYLVVVGGQVEPQRQTDPRILDYLTSAADRGCFIVGICTATFVLAQIGLMVGRKCCLHWFHRQEFQAEFPSLAVDSERVFIEADRRITCAGGGASADVALHLIARHCGTLRARKVVAGMVIESARDHRALQPHLNASWFHGINTPLVRRAVLCMDSFLSAALSVDAIAAKLQVSPITLNRAFKKSIRLSPAKFFRVVRLAYSHWELHHSILSISQIAYNYRFSDAAHFTRIHRSYYGVTPHQARCLGQNACRLKLESVQSEPIVKSILSGELSLLEC